MKQRQFFALIIFFTLMSISCSPEKKTGASEYDIANNMITNGQYDVAIATMNEKLIVNPKDQQARIILASAFAARAGVFMRDYYQVAETIMVKVRQAEAYLKTNLLIFNRIKEQIKNNEQRNLVDVIEQSYRALYQANQIIQIWQSFPTPNPAQLADLERALLVLDDYPHINGGKALYRALLRIVFLKGEMKLRLKHTNLDCQRELPIGPFMQELEVIRRSITLIFQDLILSSDSARLKLELNEVLQKLSFDFRRAIRIANNLEVKKQTDISFITKSLTENGCPK